jgi:hypothetical protein
MMGRLLCCTLKDEDRHMCDAGKHSNEVARDSSYNDPLAVQKFVPIIHQCLVTVSCSEALGHVTLGSE